MLMLWIALLLFIAAGGITLLIHRYRMRQLNDELNALEGAEYVARSVEAKMAPKIRQVETHIDERLDGVARAFRAAEASGDLPIEFPTRAEVRATHDELRRKSRCHDVRCRGFGKHVCHDLNCKKHGGN